MEDLNGVTSSSPIVAVPVDQPERDSGGGCGCWTASSQAGVRLELPSKRRRRGRWDVKGVHEQDPTLSSTGGLSTASSETTDVVAN